MSLFITFEGGEGSGKSTQANILVQHIKKNKLDVFYAQEPGTTLLGKMLREWLRDRDKALTLIPKDGSQLSLLEETLDSLKDSLLPDILLHGAAPRAELLAFTISRSQLVEEVLLPNLKKGNIVVCDRYIDSTTAYQGYGRGLNLGLVNLANEIATQGLKPDLTILLDLTPEEGLSRKWKTNKTDHFEKQELDFHRRVREGYLKIASCEPSRFLVVDATLPKEKIAEIIWRRVEELIPLKVNQA